MAYIVDQQDEDELKKQQQAEAGGDISLNSGSQLIGSGGPQKQDTGSGAYTNLQAHLQANEGNSVAPQLSEKLGGQAEEAKGALQSAEDQFRQQVDQGTVKSNQGVIDKVMQDPTTLNDQDKQDFFKLRDASYQGPDSLNLTDVGQQASNSVRDINEAIEQSKSEFGRMALLNKNFGRSNYTPGEKNLDQFLLAGDPSGRNELEGLQSRYSGLLGALDSAGQQAADYAANAKSETKTAKQSANEALNQKLASLNQGIDQGYQNRLNERNAVATNAGNALSSLDLTVLPQDLRQQLGLDNVDYVYDSVSPQDYLSVTPESALTRDSTASIGQLAEANALAELAGVPQIYLNPDVVGTQDDEALWNYNRAAFDAAQALGKTAFDTKKQNDKNAIQTRTYNDSLNKNSIETQRLAGWTPKQTRDWAAEQMARFPERANLAPGKPGRVQWDEWKGIVNDYDAIEARTPSRKFKK